MLQFGSGITKQVSTEADGPRTNWLCECLWSAAPSSEWTNFVLCPSCFSLNWIVIIHLLKSNFIQVFSFCRKIFVFAEASGITGCESLIVLKQRKQQERVGSLQCSLYSRDFVRTLHWKNPLDCKRELQKQPTKMMESHALNREKRHYETEPC